jgi:uncharacterized protein
MDFFRVENLSSPVTPRIRAGRCDTFFSRFRGLMFRQEISPDEGIIIDEKTDSILNTSVHMFFMRFPIAVIWVDNNMQVVDRKLAQPWKPYYAPCKPARYVIETHPERLEEFKQGDLIAFQPL